MCELFAALESFPTVPIRFGSAWMCASTICCVRLDLRIRFGPAWVCASTDCNWSFLVLFPLIRISAFFVLQDVCVALGVPQNLSACFASHDSKLVLSAVGVRLDRFLSTQVRRFVCACVA